MYRPLFLTLLAVSTASAATIIDFEGLADGTAVTNQFAGFTFAQATAQTAGLSLNELEYPPLSGTNVITPDGSAILISFLSPFSNVAIYLTYGAPVTVRAYDAANTEIGMRTGSFSSNLAISGVPGSSPNELFAINVAGIRSLNITGAAFALDNLTLDTAIPEPGTLWLLAPVLALLAGRRSQR